MIDASVFYAVGLALIVLGVLVIVFAMFRRSGSEDRSGRVRGGGVVVVGPIPIVFGSDKKTVKALLALSIALTVLVLVTTVVWYLLGR